MKDDFLLFKRIWAVVKPFHKKFFLLFAFLLTHTLLGLFSPYFFGKMIDSLNAQDFTGAYLYIGLTVLFWAIFLLIELFWDRFQVRNLNTAIQGYFSEWSLRQVFKLSLGQFRGENSGYRQKIFEKGQSAMEGIIYSIIYNFGPTFLRSSITAIALFFIDVRLGIIVLVAVYLYIFVIIRVNKAMRDDFKKNQELWGKEGREYSENLRYLNFIKSNAQESKAIIHYKEVFNEVESFNVPLWTRFVTWAFWRDCIPLIARSATLVFGLWLTIQGNITVGSLVIFFSWSASVFNGLSRIGQFHRNVVNKIAEVKKLFELLDEPSDVVEKENAIILDDMSGSIEFKNVTFSYPKRKKGDDSETDKDKEENRDTDEPVLHDVSFTIEAGKTTAFVGRSGSGKTTMINLIMRAYDPQSGTILIDRTDLRDVDLHTYRKQIGVVEQEVEVFDKTVKHNVLFPIDSPELVTENELAAIAKDSGMDEFEDRLTHGFDTKIGEKGIQLSGGQKQRVGIARVLAKKPKILIFDEATSNLDSVNEKNIHDAMSRALEGRTGIIIAHRLATVMSADKIIVMNEGDVVGQGTHQELLETCKQYQDLVKLQNLEFSE